jgi:hypothetical protein
VHSNNYFVVRVERSGPWDWSRGLRQRAGFDEHARFMDRLVDDGFILLGGPLGTNEDDGRDILHVVIAPSEERSVADSRGPVVKHRHAEDHVNRTLDRPARQTPLMLTPCERPPF